MKEKLMYALVQTPNFLDVPFVLETFKTREEKAKHLKDAHAGQILMKYIDTLDSPSEDDPLAKISQELTNAVAKELELQHG